MAKERGVKLGNPNGAEALRRAGKGGDALRAAVSANAQAVADDLAPVIADTRSQGHHSLRTIAAELMARGIALIHIDPSCLTKKDVWVRGNQTSSLWAFQRAEPVAARVGCPSLRGIASRGHLTPWRPNGPAAIPDFRRPSYAAPSGIAAFRSSAGLPKRAIPTSLDVGLARTAGSRSVQAALNLGRVFCARGRLDADRRRTLIIRCVDTAEGFANGNCRALRVAAHCGKDALRFGLRHKYVCGAAIDAQYFLAHPPACSKQGKCRKHSQIVKLCHEGPLFCNGRGRFCTGSIGCSFFPAARDRLQIRSIHSLETRAVQRAPIFEFGEANFLVTTPSISH